MRRVRRDVGGGFGTKIYHYAEEAIVTWAARKVGRPVKWTADRVESFLTDAHGRDHTTTAQIAFDADHKITAFKDPLRWIEDWEGSGVEGQLVYWLDVESRFLGHQQALLRLRGHHGAAGGGLRRGRRGCHPKRKDGR